VIIWQIFRDQILELSVDRVAHLENVILKETLANQDFMKKLEGPLKEALKSGGGGYKSS
jgi:hypothetical protein